MMRLRLLLVVCFGAACVAPPVAADEKDSAAASGIVDLSLLVSPEYPCTWPVGLTQYLLTPSRTLGPGAYRRDMVLIDEHTGTQWDAPAHFVPPPDSGLPGASPMGLITNEKVPVWRFVGEACVIDLTKHVDEARPGESFLITPEMVTQWEKEHRKLGPGDVVVFYSGYTDRYYRPFPEGDRFVADVLANEAPGWPGPTPECMKLLGERGVWAAAIDSASMGPMPTLAAATHQAGGAYGLIWTECATNLGKLPATGSAYVLLPAKHAGGSGGEARAIGITQPKLAKQLIEGARKKQVVDLSVLLDDDLPITWPGDRPGTEATRYLGKTLNAFNPARGPYMARTHMLDSQVGTHLVTPSFALPPAGFDNARYAAEVQKVLAAYEAKFGPRGTSDTTIDKVPLEQLMGPAYVIDVRELLPGDVAKSADAKSAKAAKPNSPVITLKYVQEQEKNNRPIVAGDVVIFRSGYSDKYFKPIPEGSRVMADPLVGKAAGWLATEPEVINYLAGKGVRLIGTDGPTLGGADPAQALMVYWAAGSRGVCLVEYLTGLAQLPASGAYFLFGPIRLAGAHGGYGRALAVY